MVDVYIVLGGGSYERKGASPSWHPPPSFFRAGYMLGSGARIKITLEGIVNTWSFNGGSQESCKLPISDY